MALRFLSLIAAIAACGSWVCALVAILLPKSQTAGIATVKIDLAHLLSLNRRYGSRSEAWIRNFDPLPGVVQTVAAAATSVTREKATGVVSEAQAGISAAAATATAAAGSVLGGIDPDTVPQNVSIGSHQWCIGYQHRSECHQPPVQLSDILPDSVLALFQNHKDQLQHLLDLLGKTIEGTVRYPLIVATVLVLAIMAYWIWLQTRGREIPKHVHILILTFLSLGCLACGVLPTASIFIFQSRLQHTIHHGFPPLSVEDGCDGLLSLGSLGWMMLMTTSIFATLLL